MAVRRLLTLGHSYAVHMNRRLICALRDEGAGRWEVFGVAPERFHGTNDLRSVSFRVKEGDEGVRAVPAYFTRRVHVFSYGRQLKEILGEKWDVVHAWEEPYIRAGAQIARHLPADAKFVFRTAQSLNKWYPPPFSLYERRCLGRADGWLCSGKLVAENLRGRLDYADKPHEVIPLGYDAAAFFPHATAGAECLRRLDWSPDGPPVIGYLGRFVEAKGIHLICAALQALRTPYRALFVGDGPLAGELLAWQRREPQRVRVVRGVKHGEVPPFVNAMSVLVAPSRTTPRWREQFGRMLIEGMACGVPVVGSDSGEIPNVIGDAGLVLPENDAAAWTAALGELLESLERRRQLGEAGRQRALEKFTWTTVARQHLRFFDRLYDGAR